MKKLFLTVAAVTTALFLMSCGQPNSGTENVNDDYNKPSLPEAVGEDPFRRNTYASDYEKWVFSDDGKLTQYAKDNDSDFVAEAELEYSYNEETGLLTARVNKIQQRNSSKEYVLMSYDEALSQLTKIPAFEEAFPREDWDEALEMVKSRDGWAEILGVAENASDETILRAFYNFQKQSLNESMNEVVKSLKKRYEKLYTYKASIGDDETNFETYYPENTSLECVNFRCFKGWYVLVSINDAEEVVIGKMDENNHVTYTHYDVTDFSDSQIKAKEWEEDTIITLSYTKSWNEGAFTLKVLAVDDGTKSLIGEGEIELNSSSERYYLSKVD
ncbi:MAG: hypothetical protein J6Z11_04960 [Candidatus Riflebacteria bacterium]|nr:hypothetical protein [Candidatus Riflebacteria bacterium]